MNPLPRRRTANKGTSSKTTIVLGGSSSAVQAHTHPASQIISGTLADARLPQRLGISGAKAQNLNAVNETGWVSTDVDTENKPSGELFCSVFSVKYGLNPGQFVAQTAYSALSTAVYFRIANNFIWGAWERIDKAGTRQPYEVAMAVLTAPTAPAPVSSATNTECFVASKMTRNRLDLENATDVRLQAVVHVNGNAAGATLKLSYTTTEASTWSGTDAGCTLPVGTGTVGIVRDSGWQPLAAGAKVANCSLAVLVGGAFSTPAPTIGSLTLFIR